MRAPGGNQRDGNHPLDREEMPNDKYAEHGTAQFVMPDVLKLPPINQHGNVMEIAQQFGGEGRLVEAVTQLQRLLYAA